MQIEKVPGRLDLQWAFIFPGDLPNVESSIEFKAKKRVYHELKWGHLEHDGCCWRYLSLSDDCGGTSDTEELQYAHTQVEREDRQADCGGEKDGDVWDFTQWFYILQSGTLRDCPGKTLQQFPPPPTLRFKALAFISQTDEWHSPRLLCVWIVSIPILRNDQTKGTHWEKRLTAVKIFSFFISIMVPKWCFGADSSTQTHTSTQTRTRTLWIPRFSPHSSSSC